MKFLILLFLSINCSLSAQNKYQKWLEKVELHIPEKATIETDKKNVLLFSLATGYKHSVIPYVNTVMKRMAEKTNAFDLTISNDITAIP